MGKGARGEKRLPDGGTAPAMERSFGPLARRLLPPQPLQRRARR
jgi:hypothetical protein